MEPLKLKINVTRIDKSEIFEGKNGKYIDVVFWPRKDGTLDQYGNAGFLAQEISRARRDAGEKGPIIGNAAPLQKPKPQASQDKSADAYDSASGDDDIPF